MKKVFFLLPCLMLGLTLMAQPPKIEAERGMTFGEPLTAGTTAIPANEAAAYLTETERKGDVHVTGEVVEVCKAEGCWLRLKTNDGTILVKMKDHAFLVPVSLVGKTVALQGPGAVKETSVEMLRHYAEDAGKSKEEIAAITQPKKEVVIQAKGVVVL